MTMRKILVLVIVILTFFLIGGTTNISITTDVVLDAETELITELTSELETELATELTLELETELATELTLELETKSTTELTTEKKSQNNQPVLNPVNGTVEGPSGKETYYNLNMSGVISIMRSIGYDYEYWIRDDGVKMFGEYIMCAANLEERPRGTIIETSLGTAIVCDTGGFAKNNPYQIDIAVNW